MSDHTFDADAPPPETSAATAAPATAKSATAKSAKPFPGKPPKVYPVDLPPGPEITNPRTPEPRRPRSARRQFGSTILVLEAFVVFFAILVALGLDAGPAGRIWLLGGSLALACLLLAGVVSWPGGYVVGSALQLVLVAGGVIVPAMFFVGGIFAALWVAAMLLGGRIDAERKAWALAHPPRPE